MLYFQLNYMQYFLIFFYFFLVEEIIFRSWNGDILKANVHSNETELLMKNTTFVSA